jgi:hypothetical protein
MRCKNCGWENPAGNARCEKCDAAIVAGNEAGEVFDSRKTAVGCPECGYPQRAGDASCPNCGHASRVNVPEAGGKGTINPWARHEGTCSLTMLPREGEKLRDPSRSFTGDEILLTRENTEPENHAITSKVQAELVRENGTWYIRDKSALKTTFVYAGERRALKSGDIVLLGDRLFEFNG